jgi:hypothetical protein
MNAALSSSNSPCCFSFAEVGCQTSLDVCIRLMCPDGTSAYDHFSSWRLDRHLMMSGCIPMNAALSSSNSPCCLSFAEVGCQTSLDVCIRLMCPDGTSAYDHFSSWRLARHLMMSGCIPMNAALAWRLVAAYARIRQRKQLLLFAFHGCDLRSLHFNVV